MTGIPNRLRATYAAEIFLASMRKSFFLANPGEENPVKPLNAYPEKQRSAIINAVSKAVMATQPEGDEAFEKWRKDNATNDQ